jgi:hypothetical protein
VQVVEVIVNAPASAGAGVQFVLTGGANIRNNGPVTPAIVDTTFAGPAARLHRDHGRRDRAEHDTSRQRQRLRQSQLDGSLLEPGLQFHDQRKHRYRRARISLIRPSNNLMSGSDTTNVS